MGSVISSAMGAGNGLMAGLVANQKEGGTDTGNAYGGAVKAAGGVQGLGDAMNKETNSLTAYQGDPTAQLQNNSVLGGLFGKGGTMDQTNQEAQNLANTGYALTDSDKTAYGQASGNIARQFGQSDQSMAQALSDRGLSNSGVAGAAFSGAQGNKQEALAGLQTKIADNRMQMNLQRLGQTRAFLGQLGNQAQSGINEQQQLGRQQAQDTNQVNIDKYNQQSGLLGNYQGQQNEGLQQQQQTAHGSTLSNALGGMSAGTQAGMSGGGGGKQKQGTQAGGDVSDASSLFA